MLVVVPPALTEFAMLPIVAAALTLATLTTPVTEDRTAFVGGKIFDGHGESARPLGALVVESGRITAVLEPGDEALVALAGDDAVTRIDCTGHTVIPGLFDLHAHIGTPGGAMHLATVVQPEEQLRTQLYCGVTTVVDLHSPHSIFELRDRSRSDASLARLYAAGLAFTRTGGHPVQFGAGGMIVDTEDDVAPRLEELMAYEPDVVKSVLEHGAWGGLPEMPTMDDVLTEALADGVHAAGLRLFTHIWSLDEARTAVVAGSDVLAHGIFLDEADEPLARAMVDRGVAYVPTLSVTHAGVSALRGDLPYDVDVIVEALHPDLAEILVEPDAGTRMMLTPMARLDASGANERARSNLEFMHHAGVTIGVGTDAGNPFVPHGPAVAYELRLYVEAGLSPAEALRAATLGSATALGVEGDFGTLDVGKVADVVVVAGDPTTAIADVASVVHVMKDGQLVDRAATRALNEERRKPVVPFVVGDEVPTLLGDFDDGSLTSSWGGTWVAQDDSIAPGGTSSAGVSVEDGALVLQGELARGFMMGPFAGTNNTWGPGFRRLADVQHVDALRLRARGTPRPFTVTLLSSRVRDWDNFAAPLNVTEEWSEITIPFTSFRQTGFGQSLEWTGRDLIGLSFDARNPPFGGGALGEFRLEIDSIEFVSLDA